MRYSMSIFSVVLVICLALESMNGARGAPRSTKSTEPMRKPRDATGSLWDPANPIIFQIHIQGKSIELADCTRINACISQVSHCIIQTNAHCSANNRTCIDQLGLHVFDQHLLNVCSLSRSFASHSFSYSLLFMNLKIIDVKLVRQKVSRTFYYSMKK